MSIKVTARRGIDGREEEEGRGVVGKGNREESVRRRGDGRREMLVWRVNVKEIIREERREYSVWDDMRRGWREGHEERRKEIRRELRELSE